MYPLAELLPVAKNKWEATVKGRVSVGVSMKNVFGGTAAFMLLSLVKNTLPTKFEAKYVWGHHNLVRGSGVYVRKLVLHPFYRSSGIRIHFLNRAWVLAIELGTRLHMDVCAEDTHERAFLRNHGARESIFWNTPKGKLMVRYMWP